MFENFPQSDVDIVGGDGAVKHHTKALLQSGKGTLPDPRLLIEVGDEIRRVLPNGMEETFEILDFEFREDFHGIPAHFNVKLRRKGLFPNKQGGNYDINVHGSHSRVMIASSDRSVNICSSSEDVFAKLVDAISASSAEQKADMLEAVQQMKLAGDSRNSFLVGYQKLISSAAEHVTILAPFLPALAHMVGG